MEYRRIDIVRDRDILLELHCLINYASETPYARRMPYEQYQAKWLSTSQPERFLSHLAETMQDERTLAEFLEEAGVVVGYLWLTFHDLLDYGITIAEVMDLGVAPEYQRQGIGLELLRHAEEVARQQGATLLRSDTGAENVASQGLHEKLEFGLYKLHYEKVLRPPE
jgi:ribosomal protein S18 acetylase RimI-like enzyme